MLESLAGLLQMNCSFIKNMVSILSEIPPRAKEISCFAWGKYYQLPLTVTMVPLTVTMVTLSLNMITLTATQLDI